MNICHFSGRITRDCETRYTQNGTSVSNFSLAVETGFGDYKRTEFPKFVLWKRENLVPHLTKGKAIAVSAELQERDYTDKEGNKRRSTEFVVRDIEFQQGGGGQGQQQQTQGPSETDPGPSGSPFPNEAGSMGDAPFMWAFAVLSAPVLTSLVQTVGGVL